METLPADPRTREGSFKGDFNGSFQGSMKGTIGSRTPSGPFLIEPLGSFFIVGFLGGRSRLLGLGSFRASGDSKTEDPPYNWALGLGS